MSAGHLEGGSLLWRPGGRRIMTRPRRAMAGLVVVLGTALAGCATEWTEHRGVPLVWRTEDEAFIGVRAGLPGHRLRVAPVVDRRQQDPSLIGVNVERPERQYPVTTRDDVAAWATRQFAQVLRRQGVEVVEAGETETVELELLRLMVTEGNRFEGVVDFGVTVRNTRGDVIWTGGLAGESKRRGRSYKLDNYYQAITIAFDSAARGLIGEPTFLAALGR